MSANYGSDLAEFVRMWRQHFLDEMKPRFLPNTWSVDHGLVVENGKARVAPTDSEFVTPRLGAGQRLAGFGAVERAAGSGVGEPAAGTGVDS